MTFDGNRDTRLDKLITPEVVAGLYDAAIWAATAKRGIPPDKAGPSLRAEALQKLYSVAYERGRREERLRLADDGK